jgi:hypothetical protein
MKQVKDLKKKIDKKNRKMIIQTLFSSSSSPSPFPQLFEVGHSCLC